jgi:flagellar biosynthesis GTPase FlhF
MSNIINKSNHPVEVKRISVRVWKIRDEIEAAIAKKISDNEGNPEVDIEDIKEYYTRKKPDYLHPDYDPDDHKDESAGDSKPEEEKSDEEKSDEEKSDEEKSDEEKSDEEKSDEEKSDEEKSDEEKSDEEKSENKQIERTYPEKEKMSEGFALLSDLNMDKILFFSNDGFTQGQNMAIEFLIPNRFILSGEISHCINLKRKSSIISENKPNFRIEMSITYLWDGERTNLRNFLKSVEPTIPPPTKKMKRPDSDEGGDDEFEDLGF